MTSRFDELDDSARALLADAERRAEALGHPVVAPAHLALVLFDDQDGWTFTRQAHPRLSADAVRRAVASASVLDETSIDRQMDVVITLASRYAARRRADATSAEDVVRAMWTASDSLELARSRRALLLVLRLDRDDPGRWDSARLAVARLRSRLVGKARGAFHRLMRTPARYPVYVIYVLGFLFWKFVRTASLAAALIVTAPGIVTREGSRVIIARLCGTSRRGEKFFRSLGSDFSVVPLPTPSRHALVLLGPALITFVLGVVWLLPPTVLRDVAGVPLAPALTQRISDLTASDDGTVVAQLLVGQSVNVWIAFACLFASIPTYEHSRRARLRLRLGKRNARLVSLVLWPVQVFGWIARPIDAVAEFAQLPPIIGTGLVGVAAGVVTSTTIVNVVY